MSEAPRKIRSAPHPAISEAPAPGSPQTNGHLDHELDRLSLQQALLDFEVANARVIDLTNRLVASGTTIRELKGELAALRSEHATLKKEHNRILASRAFKLSKVLWALRQAIRP